MEVNREEAERIARKLLREISGILDRNQRAYALGSKLKPLPAEMILEIMQVTAVKAEGRIPLFQDGYRTLSDIRKVSAYVGYDKMAEVYTLARRKNYDEVLRFISVTPPARTLTENEEPFEDVQLREISLGHKKSLARSSDRDFINRILHDQHPAVIYNLLQNPYLTIKEVIRIASKRPTNQQVLWTVYRSARWINYYEVKKSLVNNPYCPTQISLGLLNFLLEQDLIEVAESQVLHPELQEAAQKLLRKRQADLNESDETRKND